MTTPIISIHAPPRGATPFCVLFSCFLYFNSRPSARGDYDDGTRVLKSYLFQFTPLREGRPQDGVQSITFRFISIHAPPRGATPTVRFQIKPGIYFNSRPSARGDSSRAKRKPCPPNFNSRPSARGDARLIEKRIHKIQISIHAPPRGATFKTKYGYGLILISIHAPPRGATIAFLLSSRNPRISIHAPPRGATETKFSQLIGMYFNSRPSARGDFETKFSQLIGMYFNSRPSARGDERHLLAL